MQSQGCAELSAFTPYALLVPEGPLGIREELAILPTLPLPVKPRVGPSHSYLFSGKRNELSESLGFFNSWSLNTGSYLIKFLYMLP